MCRFNIGDKIRLLPYETLRVLEGRSKVPRSQLEAFKTWKFKDSVFEVVAPTPNFDYDVLCVRVLGATEEINSLDGYYLTDQYFQKASSQKFASNYAK